ncbi:hypothetical protein AB837_00189 [bacterium AB1]|nr:hypothetical protein AB837_00189 [bacterium AB1]
MDNWIFMIVIGKKEDYVTGKDNITVYKGSEESIILLSDFVLTNHLDIQLCSAQDLIPLIHHKALEQKEVKDLLDPVGKLKSTTIASPTSSFVLHCLFPNKDSNININGDNLFSLHYDIVNCYLKLVSEDSTISHLSVDKTSELDLSVYNDDSFRAAVCQISKKSFDEVYGFHKVADQVFCSSKLLSHHADLNNNKINEMVHKAIVGMGNIEVKKESLLCDLVLLSISYGYELLKINSMIVKIFENEKVKEMFTKVTIDKHDLLSIKLICVPMGFNVLKEEEMKETSEVVFASQSNLNILFGASILKNGKINKIKPLGALNFVIKDSV